MGLPNFWTIRPSQVTAVVSAIVRELATVATQDPWLHRRQRQVMAVETFTLW